MEVIIFNGVSVLSNRVVINPALPFFNYGLGFFETILYHNSKLYRLNMHLDRLKTSICQLNCKANLNNISEESIVCAIKSNKNLSTMSPLKVKIFAAPMESEDIWSVVVTADKFNLRQKPIFAVMDKCVSDGVLKKHKSINYFNNFYTLKNHKSRDETVDEVFLINKSGRVVEGTYSNVLCIKNSVLYVTDSKEQYLEGVTQKYIIEKHKELGFKKVYAKKRGFPEDFLKLCDEIIITSSLSLALKVEKLKLSNGKVIVKSGQFWTEKIRNYLLV